MDLQDYRSKLDEIGNRKLDGLTVSEAAGLLREYSRYEKLASDTGPRPAQAPYRTPAQPRQMPSKLIGKKPEGRRRVGEIAVGRYLMTVAASVLCLLGVVVFAAGFWKGLPGAAKYFAIMLPAMAAWAVGYVRSSGAMRPFWLGVAGLGAGAAFLDAILGSSEWDLYSTTVVGILCLAWIWACFAMARRRSAWLFYVVAYAGSLIAFNLAWDVVCSFEGELLCGIVAASILAMGAVAWRSGRRHWLLAVPWMLACWHMGSYMARFRWPIVDGPVWDPCYMYFCAAMACVSVWFLPKCVPDGWRGKTAGKLALAVLAFANAYFVHGMMDSIFPYGNRAGTVLSAAILAAGVFFSGTGYLLGISVPMAALISGSGGWSGALAVSVSSLAVPFLSLKYKDKADRAGLYAFLAAAPVAVSSGARWAKDLGMCETLVYDPPRLWAFGTAAAILAVSIGLWCRFRHRAGDWSSGRLSWLLMLWTSLCVLYIPVAVAWVPEYAFLCAAAIAINGFRRLAVPGWNMREDTAARVLTAVLSFGTACAVTVECVSLGAFGTAVPAAEPPVLTATLFLLAALDAYGMVRSDSAVQGILACLAANWCLWLSADVWASDAQIAVSALGILVSAGFVAAGFRLDRRSARQSGLACALLYALKLGLYDMSLSGGLGMAAGFLVSGAGCFGISLLYNKLGKAAANASDIKSKEDGTDE